MAKKKKQQQSSWDELPVVGELKDCRQLSADHWQGTDVDGVIVDIYGGLIPNRLLALKGSTVVGLIRLTRA